MVLGLTHHQNILLVASRIISKLTINNFVSFILILLCYFILKAGTFVLFWVSIGFCFFSLMTIKDNFITHK